MSPNLLPPLLLLTLALTGARTTAADPTKNLSSRDNLVAWCIVPYDGKQRTPEQRAAMLEQLGIRKFAYDYRAKHLPSFEEEIAALDRHHVELTAVWFPDTLNKDARFILDMLNKHHRHPQLWVASYPKPKATDAETVEAEVQVLRPIAEEARKLGSSLALYNHGGWFGVPENQLALIARLKADGFTNVGIVYNLHHAHDDIPRLAEILPKIKPHLLCLTLNGMTPELSKTHLEILPVGYGANDLNILKTIGDSGYTGPFAILNHTNEDAADRLRDNIDGLNWLVAQLDGSAAPPTPALRTNALAQPTN